MQSVHDALLRFLQAAEGRYYRLVLLVGTTGSGKTAALHDLAISCGASVINVNQVLAACLLELTAKQRCLKLPSILAHLTDSAPSPLLLDHSEILFDPSLRQDPLRLLQGMARQHTVVATWNGRYLAGKLLYAEAGHPEYRCYDATDVLIVSTVPENPLVPPYETA